MASEIITVEGTSGQTVFCYILKQPGASQTFYDSDDGTFKAFGACVTPKVPMIEDAAYAVSQAYRTAAIDMGDWDSVEYEVRAYYDTAPIGVIGTQLFYVRGGALVDFGDNYDRIMRWVGENTRARIYTADAAVAGRNVAAGAASHTYVEVKADTDTDFSSPVDEFYRVFKYESSGDADPHVEEKSDTAPADGTFSTTGWVS